MRSERTKHAPWSAYGVVRGSASGGDPMLTGAMVLKRAMVVTALALPTSALAIGAWGCRVAAAAPTTDLASVCTPEQWSWTGVVTFDVAMTSFDTGVVVPVIAGTELKVVGVSADGLMSTGAARALVVTVGGVAAVGGASVPGGAVLVLGDGAPAEVRNVTVVIDRCAQVQSVAPDPGSGSSGAGTGTALPHTGATVEVGGSLIGALAIGAGTAMMVAGRRRTAS